MPSAQVAASHRKQKRRG
ncbi:hypothetical protein [Lysobacter enzymogenes]